MMAAGMTTITVAKWCNHVTSHFLKASLSSGIYNYPNYHHCQWNLWAVGSFITLLYKKFQMAFIHLILKRFPDTA